MQLPESFNKVDTANTAPKKIIIESMQKVVDELGFTISEKDQTQNWGAYFTFQEKDAAKFVEVFFDNTPKIKQISGFKLNPTLRLITPMQESPWLYHKRRAELWRVVKGPVGAKLTHSDSPPKEHQTYLTGASIDVRQEIRHRLIGLNNWAVIAEVWIHTDSLNPSNKEDVMLITEQTSPKDKHISIGL